MTKKIIIIFSLIFSILFINITPVYCSNTIVNVYIEDFSGDLSTLNVYYKYPFIKFTQYGIRELDGKQYLTFTYSSTFADVVDKLSLYIGEEEEVEIESISASDEIYINPIFKVTEPTPPPEEPEDTETPTTPPTTDEEEPTTPPVDVIVDNTEVVEELKEIKSYIVMFFALFFLYFSYKIIKEIANNTRRF